MAWLGLWSHSRVRLNKGYPLTTQFWVERALETLSPKAIWFVTVLSTPHSITRHSSQFSCSVMSDSLWPHGLHHARLPCPSPTPGVCSNSCLLSQWCHLTISSFIIPFSCLQSFPASGPFPRSQFFASGGQSIRASASVLPMNIQDWFLLGMTGLIFLQSEGLSRVFSNIQFKIFHSLVLSFLSGPTLTSIHDYWKNHRFDYTDLCQQSDSFVF